MSKKSFSIFAITLLSTVAWAVPAGAQSAAEFNVRLMQLEEQIRQLVGQVEQLNYDVQQLKRGASLGQPQKKKAAAIEQQPVLTENGEVQATELAAPSKTVTQEQGIEQIEEPGSEMVTTVIDENGNEQQVTIEKGTGPKILGTLKGSNESSGGFEGQVLVAPGGEVVTDTQTVSVEQDQPLDSPEKVYEQAYENLLRRQFGTAEAGFQTFLTKYRDHSLAGNAQYWLGETYYVQGDYKLAAKSFLTGYQEFPKSRKAADSLLRLGLSLNRLGQKEQACAAYGAVGEKFPKATEARRRAQIELKRAGC